MKLSLCLAVFNEEKNIHYPLDSAYDMADEIIIVDGGSTDKTVEIAKSYGNKIKVIVSPNTVMFHKNKQKSIEAAKGEWILQLDADEELSKDLKSEILNLLQNQKSDIKYQKETVAFWLPRKNWFLTRFLMKGGQYPDYTIRLYKNGVAKFPCKDVHENVEVKGRIGYLKNPMLHYADPDFSRYLMRWNRYTTLEAELLLREIKDQKSKIKNFWMFVDYFKIKPIKTFFLMYFRHKGFMDGLPGFIFALFSSIRFWVIYIKWWSVKSKIKNQRSN